MPFTWAEIRKHYLDACGQTTDAQAEFYAHSTAAMRELCSRIEVEELEEMTELSVKQGDDRTPFDPEVYAIHYVFNVTTGERVEPEEAGMRGRSRYLEKTTGQPPSGTVHRYVRSGGMLFVRDKADVQTKLQINFKKVPPDVTAALMAERPITPPHLDWPLVFLSASNYYATHEQMEKAQGYNTRGWALAQVAKPPHAEENRDRRERVIQWGYGFKPGL